MTIKTHNDGKEKWQSWEAWLDTNDGWGDGHYSCTFYGYGATEEEAVYNCKNSIMNFIGLAKIDINV